MKLTKKMTVLGLTLALTCAMSVPAFAEGDVPETNATKDLTTENTEDFTDLTYIEPNDWLLSIPSKIKLETAKTVDEKIEAKKVNIQPDMQLNVSVKEGEGLTAGVLTLTNDANTSVTTTTDISLDGTADTKIGAGAVIATFVGNTTEPTFGGTLYYSPLSSNIGVETGYTHLAGSYTGKITFQVATDTKTIN